MTVRIRSEGVIELAGRCAAEDAEPLLQALLAAPASSVEWQACTYLHSGVVQVLLAATPSLQGTPQDAFLVKHIAPLLDRAAKSSTARNEARTEESREQDGHI